MVRTREEKAAYQKRRREARKQQGLCQRCDNQSRPGKVFCKVCAESFKQDNVQRKKARYEKRKAEGVCVYCGNPSRADRIDCKLCSEKSRVREKRHYKKRMDNNRCLRCGEQRDSDRIYCKMCREFGSAQLMKLKRETLDAYGGCYCVDCDTDHIEFLTIEHINNDGHKHRKSLGTAGGRNFYAKLKKLGFPKDPPLEVLCFNCNVARGTYGYNPIVRQRDQMIADVVKIPLTY